MVASAAKKTAAFAGSEELIWVIDAIDSTTNYLYELAGCGVRVAGMTGPAKDSKHGNWLQVQDDSRFTARNTMQDWASACSAGQRSSSVNTA